MLWRSGASNFRPSQLMASAVNAGVVVVGHGEIAAVSLADTALDAAVGAVTDLADPAGTGGWTNLVDLTGGPLLIAPISETNQGRIAGIKFDKRELELHLRLQVLIDGVVVGDLTVAHGIGNNEDAKIKVLPLAVGAVGAIPGFHPFYCETSFTVRAARIGACGYAGSTVIYVAKINYVNVVRG